MSEQALPRGWVWSTLGEIGEYQNGRAFKKDEWSTSGRLIIRIQDLTGTGTQPNHFTGDVEPRHVVRRGDLLISWAATLGAYIWQGDEAVLNQHIFKVQSYVDRRFHYYLTTAILSDLYRQAHGSGMVHITKRRFDAMPIGLPPLAEQRRIVASIEEYLSRFDRAVAGLKRLQVMLPRYRAAVLTAACEGWLTAMAPAPTPPARDRVGNTLPGTTPAGGARSVTLGDVAKETRYGTSAKTTSEAEGIPVLRMGNIVGGRLDLSVLKYLPTNHPEFPELLLESGDLLFNRTNSAELVGKTAVYGGVPHPCSFASYLIRVRVGADVLPKFLATVLNSPYGRTWARSAASQQVGQANINATKLRAMPIRLPSLAEQRRIVAELDRQMSLADAVERSVQAALAKAARARQAILKRAFEGKLVPQHPADEPASALLERIRASQSSAIRRPTRQRQRN